MSLDDWPSDALGKALALAGGELMNRQLVFFDVGAHRGETLTAVARQWREIPLRYHAFEPNPDSFDELKGFVDRTELSGQIFCHRLAAGPTNTFVNFKVLEASAVSGILEPEEGLVSRVQSGDHLVKETTQVEQVRLDEFVDEWEVTHIDILKLDTEGYEMEVIEGAKKLLGNERVSVLVSEVFFVRYRKSQAFFWDIASYLHALGYLFVGLTDTRETSQGRLYTGNGIWVSPSLGQKLGYF